MAVVRRIAPLSAVRVGFVTGALLGLIPGIFCTVIAIAGIPFAPHRHLPHFVPLFAIVFAPLFYGTLGAIFAGLGAVFYNVASRWVGGLDVKLDGEA